MAHKDVVTFSNPIIAAGLAGLCDLYADRAVTPVEACESYLSRIAGLDGALGAFVHVDAEGARRAAHASAERWRAGQALSLLDGAPIAVKANIAVEGWPWHAGIGAYRTRTAEADAMVIARLRAAGVVLLGLTNMHEGAFGATTDNPHFGRTHNPWSYERTAGGSSGGSAAAVSAGLCAAALGTDTLGSVRIPSAFCGLFGHKPTPGLAPTQGVIPMAWSFDQVGVHARSATDAARLFAALCTEEPELAAQIADPATDEMLSAAPLALLSAPGVTPAPEVAAALDAVGARAEAAGLAVETVTLEGIDLPALRRAAMFIAAAESAVEHAEALAAEGEGVSPALRRSLAPAAERPATELAHAYREVARGAERIRERLAPYAGALLPATPTAAFSLDQPQPEATSQLTTLASLAGLAATAFPAALSDDGLPIGLQAVAWDDSTALGLAQRLAIELGAPPAYRG